VCNEKTLLGGRKEWRKENFQGCCSSLGQAALYPLTPATETDCYLPASAGDTQTVSSPAVGVSVRCDSTDFCGSLRVVLEKRKS